MIDYRGVRTEAVPVDIWIKVDGFSVNWNSTDPDAAVNGYTTEERKGGVSRDENDFASGSGSTPTAAAFAKKADAEVVFTSVRGLTDEHVAVSYTAATDLTSAQAGAAAATKGYTIDYGVWGTTATSWGVSGTPGNDNKTKAVTCYYAVPAPSPGSGMSASSKILKQKLSVQWIGIKD